MKKIYLFSILISTFCVDLFAQNQQQKDSIGEVLSVPEEILNQVTCEVDTIQVLNLSIETIKKERDSIQVKYDSLFTENEALKSNAVKNSVDLHAKDSLIDDLNKQISAFGVLNEIIYKQCLLYPLEKPYDKELIDNSQKCLLNLKIGENPKYKNVYEVYFPLLALYSEYNNEVYSFLESQKQSFELKQWKLSESYKTMILEMIKSLKYYDLYKDKDQEPWRSILFLDGIIDDFTFMLTGKKELSEENMINLINSMGK